MFSELHTKKGIKHDGVIPQPEPQSQKFLLRIRKKALTKRGEIRLMLSFECPF